MSRLSLKMETVRISETYAVYHILVRVWYFTRKHHGLVLHHLQDLV